MKFEDKIKLIASDMDGTLLNSKKQMPCDFESWVKSHKEKHVVIASGRQYATLRHDMKSIAEDVDYIAENGGVAYVGGKLIHSDFMSREDAEQCISMISSLEHATPVLCCANCAYSTQATGAIRSQIDFYYQHYEPVNNFDEVLDVGQIAKIAIYVENQSAGELFPKLKLDSPGLQMTLSGPDWIDIANKTVSKGVALLKIMEYLDISPNECMAFGDYLNDLSLIQACKHSFAMENAHADLKKAAAYQTGNNDEEGVMQVLRNLN